MNRNIVISVILYFALHAVNLNFAQIYSRIDFDPGTDIRVEITADVCADTINIKGTYSGGGTICSGVLPVVIKELTVFVDNNNVTLNWITVSEINNKGFEIERAITGALWQSVGFIPGAGTTNLTQGYQFEDRKLAKGVYSYRIKQIDYNANFEYIYFPENVTIDKPLTFELSQNYPNPGNPKSKIGFQLPYESKVVIKIYDVLGREIRTLVDNILEADYYIIEFNGENLSSGIYYYRMSAEDFTGKTHFTDIRKMVIVK